MSRIRVSVVYVVTSLRLDDLGFESGHGKKFIASKTSTPPLQPTQIPVQGASKSLSLGADRPERKADISPASSVEIINGAVPLTPPYAFVVCIGSTHCDSKHENGRHTKTQGVTFSKA